MWTSEQFVTFLTDFTYSQEVDILMLTKRHSAIPRTETLSENVENVVVKQMFACLP